MQHWKVLSFLRDLRIHLWMGGALLWGSPFFAHARESKVVRKENYQLIVQFLVQSYEKTKASPQFDPDLWNEYKTSIRQKLDKKSPLLIEKELEKIATFEKALAQTTDHSKRFRIWKEFSWYWVEHYFLENGPAKTPSYDLGQSTYQRSCQACHGSNRNATEDAPLAPHLKLGPPARTSNAFKQFATPWLALQKLRFGDTHQAVQSRSDHELWSVVFYFFTTPEESSNTAQPKTKKGKPSSDLSLVDIAHHSDHSLEKKGHDLDHVRNKLGFAPQTKRR